MGELGRSGHVLTTDRHRAGCGMLAGKITKHGGGSRKDNFECKFPDDDTSYWFSGAALRGWLVDDDSSEVVGAAPKQPASKKRKQPGAAPAAATAAAAPSKPAAAAAPKEAKPAKPGEDRLPRQQAEAKVETKAPAARPAVSSDSKGKGPAAAAGKEDLQQKEAEEKEMVGSAASLQRCVHHHVPYVFPRRPKCFQQKCHVARLAPSRLHDHLSSSCPALAQILHNSVVLLQGAPLTQLRKAYSQLRKVIHESS